MKLLVLSGTYNEKGNIERMIDAILSLEFPQESPVQESLPSASTFVSARFSEPVAVHYLVIDDNSEDGTGQIIRNYQAKYPDRLHLICREGKLGLGSAYLAGFCWGLECNYDAFCQIDADFSHDPTEIPKMLAYISDSVDFVIGSRYVDGGEAKDWRSDRKLLSHLGTLYAQIVMDTSFKDMTGGFNLWKKEVVASLVQQKVVAMGFFLSAGV